MTPHETATTAGDSGQPTPQLRLARGDATPEEVAALLAVLTAASAGEVDPAARRTTAWASRERAVRRPVHPGPGAWRASAWPG